VHARALRQANAIQIAYPGCGENRVSVKARKGAAEIGKGEGAGGRGRGRGMQALISAPAMHVLGEGTDTVDIPCISAHP